MTKSFQNMESLNENVLISVSGGGKNEANLFLSGISGAAQGVAFCAQAGVFMPWQGYALCAAGGAAVNIIWPH